jgi:hypothetical protein
MEEDLKKISNERIKALQDQITKLKSSQQSSDTS